jgi:hypothetical protein
LLTDFFSFSRNVGSGSFFPNSEIMRSRASLAAQPKIVTEADSDPLSPVHHGERQREDELLDVDFYRAQPELAVLNR